MNLIVASVTFTETAMEVAFMDLDEDVRYDGALVATRTYAIDEAHPEFGEDVADIRRSLIELVEDVHQGFGKQPKTTVPEGEDDEAEGMGS